MNAAHKASLSAALLLCGAAAVDGAVLPYGVDGPTLHLWRFDESAEAAAVDDAVPGGVGLTAIANGATLGNPSFTGFASAASTYDAGPDATLAANPSGVPGRDAYLAPLPLVNGSGDNVALTCTGADGAFTFEALVRADFGPTNLAVAPDTSRYMQILSADGDSTERVMQFRILWNTANDPTPELQFVNISAAGIQNLVATLPLAGSNALAQGWWYHVAVAYNGQSNTADNLRLYWTRVETNRTRADLLASLCMTHNLPAGPADWTIGNEGRATGGSDGNWVGLIDEVRLSGIARSPTDFLFVVDADGDGLPDSWETTYFPTIATWGAGDDPDGDGPGNLEEYLAGTVPSDPASNPSDTDADGLPDAWELHWFGSLAQGPADDPDGDGRSNLQEYQAGTPPVASGVVSAVPHARYIPVEDGDPETSEFGYAGSSSINAVSFICSGLRTVGDRQFLVYYGRHATDPTCAHNNKIAVARRDLAANVWEVFRTSFTANNIADGHDVVSFGIDGDGFMHISWGMHGDAYHYACTTHPVTGTDPVEFGPDRTMTGSENAVTYPQFIPLPDGDLLYLFREGGSGNGDLYLNRYLRASGTWTNVHRGGGSQTPFIKGTGWTPNYNAYWNLPCLDGAGNLFLIWTWRYNSDSPAGEAGYQTNHDFDYGLSPDGGVTWRRSDGSAYTLPITERGEAGTNTMAEKILSIPEGWSLINQAGMCLDRTGKPVLAAWWAPGAGTNDHRRQYMVAFPGTNGWVTRQVSGRTIDAAGDKKPESEVRDLGRPVIVADRDDRLIVLYRDNEGSNGLTVVHSLPRAIDPDRLAWTAFDLTTANLGNYEPVIDLARWDRDNVLSIVYQPTSGQGYTPPSNTASEIGVLEWDTAAYFAHAPELSLDALTASGDAWLSFRAQPGWAYRLDASTNLASWDGVLTLPGTGGVTHLAHPGGAAGPRRFWRLEAKEGGFGP